MVGYPSPCWFTELTSIFFRVPLYEFSGRTTVTTQPVHDRSSRHSCIFMLWVKVRFPTDYFVWECFIMEWRQPFRLRGGRETLGGHEKLPSLSGAQPSNCGASRCAPFAGAWHCRLPRAMDLMGKTTPGAMIPPMDPRLATWSHRLGHCRGHGGGAFGATRKGLDRRGACHGGGHGGGCHGGSSCCSGIDLRCRHRSGPRPALSAATPNSFLLVPRCGGFLSQNPTSSTGSLSQIGVVVYRQPQCRLEFGTAGPRSWRFSGKSDTIPLFTIKVHIQTYPKIMMRQLIYKHAGEHQNRWCSGSSSPQFNNQRSGDPGASACSSPHIYTQLLPFKVTIIKILSGKPWFQWCTCLTIIK